MSGTPQLDPAKTALVLIEYQNEFTSEGGDRRAEMSR
jgi:nicotinamidase-related amidase